MVLANQEIAEQFWPIRDSEQVWANEQHTMPESKKGGKKMVYSYCLQMLYIQNDSSKIVYFAYIRIRVFLSNLSQSFWGIKDLKIDFQVT